MVISKIIGDSVSNARYNKIIYLDHNATTPILPEVIDAMLPYLREHFGNPSSGHAYGQIALAAVDHARAQVASLLSCDPSEILFTSGGTESNNLAIRGITAAQPHRKHIVTSTIEHPATAQPCTQLEQQGYQITRLGVDEEGRIRTEDALSAINNTTALLTIMHSNNETGVLQPVDILAHAAKTNGVFVHTDAAQSVGKVHINVQYLGVDLLSIAGHKLYAPKGVGALYVRKGTPLSPLILGANHERGLRPGTENVASIVALGLACQLASNDLTHESARLLSLRSLLWTRLLENIPNLKCNGLLHERLPNTLNVRFPHVSGIQLLNRTPEIAASTGSACHKGHDRASPMILAMGIPQEDAIGSVRLTLGRTTTEADILLASDALTRAWRSFFQLN